MRSGIWFLALMFLVSCAVQRPVCFEKQAKSNACWLYSLRHLLYVKTGSCIAADSLLDILGEDFAQIYKSNKGLNDESKKHLVHQLQLKFLAPANHLPIVYSELIDEHKGFWITTSETINGFGTHGIVISGYIGKPDWPDKFTGYNPANGKVISLTPSELFYLHENPAKFRVWKTNLELGIQIIYLN